MADPGERIDLPSGVSCFYVEDDHSYWRCKEDGSRGKRLTGVTTSIKPIDFDAERLLKWAARENGKGIARLAESALALDDPDAIRSELSWLDSHESIWQALEDSRLTFLDIRDQAATRGTNVHEIGLRALSVGRPVPDLDALTDEERGYVKGVMGFWLEQGPQPTQVEQIVCDPELGVAGRFDLRTELLSREGLGIVDAKTSKWIGEKDHCQVALYAHLAEISGFGSSKWTAILQLRPDGSYDLIEGEASTEDALAAVDVYRRRARIRSAAGKAYKARQQEKAAA